MANKKHIKLWVDALRSGEYEQGRYALSTLSNREGKRRYCCLGVACEVAIANGVPVVVIEQDSRNAPFLYDGNGSGLPPMVATWLGINELNPILMLGNGKQASAAYLNDGLEPVPPVSFEEIADAIERTFLTGEPTQ